MIKGLSELDHCIMAIVWDRGPCSAYLVRKQFEHSASTTWSSSAGSVYPVIKRLEERGMFRAKEASDGRRTRLLTVTAKAKKALRHWIGVLPTGIGRSTADPIRTRAQFLSLLTPDERKQFVHDATERTREGLRIAEDQIAKAIRFNRGEREAFVVGLTGVRLELLARLAWLNWLGELAVGSSCELPGSAELRRLLRGVAA